MNLYQISITVFCFIETLNILTLYFKPNSRIGNGLGVFNSLDKALADEEKKDFVSYLINWVAGTKLIFVMLGVVVVVLGDITLHFYTVIALILSILSFYWRLYPIIRKLDHAGEITPKGYSRTLNYMIIGFLSMFVIVILVKLLTGGLFV